MRCSIYLMSLVLTFMATASFADTPWPQSFDLMGRSSASYKFPVGQPGAVVVSVQWKGDPVTIRLTKSNGQEIYSNAANSPGQLSQSREAKISVSCGAPLIGRNYRMPLLHQVVLHTAPRAAMPTRLPVTHSKNCG